MEVKTPNTTAMVEKAAAPAAKRTKPAGAIDYLGSDSFKQQLSKALPKFFDTDRFVRSAISEFRLNPALQECSVPSVLGFFMQAAMCGLEPGSSILGQCYPVPFNNKKTGAKECQFILGYKGMKALVDRSDKVMRIEARCVYEKDELEITYGLDSDLKHKPYLDGDPGALVGAYCIVRFKDGSFQYEYMPKFRIDQHRKRSKASNYGPWVTDYDAMAVKTVFRSMFKWLPISIETAQIIATDNSVINYKLNSEPTAAPEDIIDIEFVAAAPEEGGDE